MFIVYPNITHKNIQIDQMTPVVAINFGIESRVLFFFKYNSILDYLWIFFMILVKNKKFLIFFTNEYVFLITKN